MKYTSLIVLIIASYVLVYMEGLKEGEIRYKHSINFQMTLASAYHFGCLDCGRK